MRLGDIKRYWLLSFSLEGKLVFIACSAMLLASAPGVLLYFYTASAPVALSVGALAAVVITVVAIKNLTRPIRDRIAALGDGLESLIDGDFSFAIADTTRDELSPLIESYNGITQRFRLERQHLYQRELLLDKVIQNSSLCVVLADDSGKIIYSNDNARQMFNRGRPVQGLSFAMLLERVPSTLKAFIEKGNSGIFKSESQGGDEGESEFYHVSLGRFVLNAQRHNLYLIKHMTKELNRKEADTWKNVIRIISHELNNSLAPISSLSHTGALMVEKKQHQDLAQVFSTIADRAQHVKTFIDGYAKLSKLPIPHLTSFLWPPMIDALHLAFDFSVPQALPEAPAIADAAQIEQLLVNVLKNAQESGSDSAEITCVVQHKSAGFIVEVADRGTGMSQKALENALMPFYTTKRSGSGVGLALCREIVDAHGGELSISNRSGGGVLVRFFIPQNESGRNLV